MHDTFEVFVEYGPLLLEGLYETVLLTLAGALCAFMAAMVLHAAAASPWRPLRAVVRLYTELILGLPILVLLYCIYFAGPGFGLRLSAVASGLLTLTLYYSPYMAEAIRAAVAAIPSGQIEAGQTVGMGPFAVARRIVLPQAGALALPALVGLLIGLAKDTAILSIVSVKELSYMTKQVVSRSFMPFEVWAGVALIYWVCLSTLDLAMRRLERHLTRHRRLAP
ncbi:MAG TPA: amino acid ABC transporter permease [Xanthobacteraceae bacterium]|nr:amino acid ABC transporter permease [Xanthobacteraceae bacterium]